MSSMRLESWSIGGPRDSEGRPLFNLPQAYEIMKFVCERFSCKYTISCEHGKYKFDNHVQCYMWVNDKHKTVKQFIDRVFRKKGCEWYMHEKAKKYVDRTKKPHWIAYPLKEDPQVYETCGVTSEELEEAKRLMGLDPDYKALKAEKSEKSVSRAEMFDRSLYDLAVDLQDCYSRKKVVWKGQTKRWVNRMGEINSDREYELSFDKDPYSDDWYDRKTWEVNITRIVQYFVDNAAMGWSFFTKNKIMIEQIIFDLKLDEIPQKYRPEKRLTQFFERLQTPSTATNLVIVDVENNPDDATISTMSTCSGITSESSNRLSNVSDDFVNDID